MKCELNASVECVATTTEDCGYIWNCQSNRNARKICELEKILIQTLSHISSLTQTVNHLSSKLNKKGAKQNAGTNSNSQAELVK